MMTSTVGTYRVPEDGLQQEGVGPGERDEANESEQLRGGVEAALQRELAHLAQPVKLRDVQLGGLTSENDISRHQQVALSLGLLSGSGSQQVWRQGETVETGGGARVLA